MAQRDNTLDSAACHSTSTQVRDEWILILVLGLVEIEEERSILTHAAAEKMIKSPRNIKYTKYQKNYTHSRGTPAKRNTSVDFGTYGLQCNEPTLLSLKQLETCRRTLRRVVARRAPI